MVKSILVKGTPWFPGDNSSNKLDYLGIYFKPDMINELLKSLFNFDPTSDLTVLDEQSGLFLRPTNNIGGREMLTLEMIAALANKQATVITSALCLTLCSVWTLSSTL